MWSSDSRYLAFYRSGRFEGILIWDFLETDSKPILLTDGSSYFLSTSFSSTSNLIATADARQGSLRIWQVGTHPVGEEISYSAVV